MESTEIKTVNMDEYIIPKIEQIITECNQAAEQVGHDEKAVAVILKNLENSTEDTEVIAEVIENYKRQQNDIRRFLDENGWRKRAAEDLKKGLESGNPETINLIANFCQAFGII